MPAAIPIVIGLSAAATAGSMVMQNQQIQHAKGAAQAQETQMNAQVEAAKKQDQQATADKSQTASATQSAAIQALRASMASTGGMGGSILTGPSGSASTTAPTVTKSLLGA